MRSILLAIVGSLVLAACGSSSTTTITRPVSTQSSAPSSTTTVTATTAAGPVYFQGVAGPPLQRPGTLELTGDGTLYVNGVQWSSWGSATATGSGNAQYHGCEPSCAQATPHTAFVAIRLSGIRTCAGRQYYSGLTLTLNSGQLLDESFVQRSWSPC